MEGLCRETIQKAATDTLTTCEVVANASDVDPKTVAPPPAPGTLKFCGDFVTYPVPTRDLGGAAAAAGGGALFGVVGAGAAAVVHAGDAK